MSEALGALILLAVVVALIVLDQRSKPRNVAARRHQRYQHRFQTAKTPADRLRHASAYLHEVAATSDAATAAVAADLFALAARRNGATGAPVAAAAAPAKTPE